MVVLFYQLVTLYTTMSYRGERKSNVHKSAEGYDLYASSYDASTPFLNTFERDELFKLMGDLNGKKVLDLGSGTGRSVTRLKVAGATDVTAIDISKEMVEILKKDHSHVDARLGDVEELPFEDDSFDLVNALFVIVHLGDLREMLDEAYRVLKPGGVFILSNVNQRKAPKLKLKDGTEIVIKSYYHMPKKVLEALENSFFKVEKEVFVKEGGVWINQLVKAVK
ncbi:class I SAM-dependent methyltransferase [Candidatus Peregrinibacteria bacterium]|jgi:ubiquinone/menaquinone biosynthesis C-methylase UbiE|nr:class I SAM-dependent methyltransferase [Candidatus Peregrinibacteria bacterium]